MNVDRSKLLRAGLAAAALLAACSDDPGEPGPNDQEVLVVVNSTEATLSVVPVDAPAAKRTVPLTGTNPTPVDVSVRGGMAVVPLGLDDAVVAIDLATGQPIRTVPLADGSGATGSAVLGDSVAYVANPLLNSVTRVDFRTGDTASVAVGRYPQGVVALRGLVFVVHGNLENFRAVAPSYLLVIDPGTNARAGGIDSIPLAGPGNAQYARVGDDDRIYVMSSGNFDADPSDPAQLGQVSVVDARSRTLVDSIGGFGAAPGHIAVDSERDRLYVGSLSEGLMVYDLASGTMVRGAGNGILESVSGVSVDGRGRVYAIAYGNCVDQPGTASVIDPETLAVAGTIALGGCSTGGSTTFVPPLPVE
jgi:hypothetical protein